MKLNKIPPVAIAAMLLTAVAPEESQAGAGYWFYLTNDMTPSKEDGTYPRVTMHEYGGWSCWYPNDIGNWDAYAVPGNRERPLYTEVRDSLGCAFEHTSNIQFGVFIKPNENSPWVRVGHPAKLFNQFNSDQAFTINPPLPWNNIPFFNVCGLKFSDGLGGYAPLTNVNYVKVSGTPKLEGCEDAYPNTGISISSSSKNANITSSVNASDVSQQASDESFFDENVKTIKIKVGKSKTITLPTLDQSSTWELDGGICQGDDVLESNLNKSQTKRRVVLPHTVKVKANGVGQKVCHITAYHYPERTIVQKAKVIFVAK